MKFRDGNEEDLQINLTPLIDVVFLLLIFFMVSTTFSKESQLQIKLPEASVDQREEKRSGILQIEINRDGIYAVRGPDDKEARQLVNSDQETLQRAMKLVTGGDLDIVTVIRADRKTPHEAVVQAMDAARQLGLLHITFSTQIRQTDPEQ